MSHKRSHILIPVVIVLLFIFWRLAVFSLTHPSFFKDDYEEVYRGTVAREIALGTSIPLWDYRPDNYAGGFYVIVTLLPFFLKLFNFSMLGLKSLGITHTAITLLLWYAVLARYVNRRTALIFAAIYIFAPFRYIVLSSLSLGDHAETCSLTALTVFLLFRMLQKPPNQRLLSYLALGLLAGFSLWFAYIYAVTIAAILIFILFNHHQKVFTKKNILISGGGFLAGFSFWLFFNFQQGFSGLVVQGAPLWELFKFENIWKPLISWREFFLFKLLFHPHAPDIWHLSHNKILIAYVTVFAGLTVGALNHFAKQPREMRKEIFNSPVGLSIIYIFCFLLIQQMFDSVGLRFLLPFYLFALVLISYTLAEISRTKPWLTILSAGCLIALAVTSTVLRFDTAHFGDYLSRKGYSIKTLGKATGIFPRIKKTLLSDFSSLRNADKPSYILAFVDQMTLEQHSVAEEIKDHARYIPDEFKGYYAYLTGRELMLRYHNFAETLKFIEPLSVENPFYYEQALKGLLGAMFQFDPEDLDIERTKQDLPDSINIRLAAYDGFQFTKKYFARDTNFKNFKIQLLKEIEPFELDKKERFLRGVGRHLFRLWSSDPAQSPVKPEDLDGFPKDIRTPLLRGVANQMLRKHIVYYSSPILWTWNEFYSSLEKSGQDELIAGLKSSVERWALPEEVLPLEKMDGLNEYHPEPRQEPLIKNE